MSGAAGRLVFPEVRAGRPGAWDAAEALARPAAEGGIGCGGFILFGGRVAEVRDGIARLRAAAGQPIVIVSDLERGAGQQVGGLTRLPHLMALGAADDESLAERAGALTAREARSVGIDGVFAPMVDLADEPLSPIVGVRAFGADPARVAALGLAWTKGCQDAGALACAKHYPGHGSVRIDSHDAAGAVLRSREALDAADLVPFGALARGQVAMVMTAHLACPALGAEEPVTVSPSALRVLREDLGFQGLIVTDALTMEGVRGQARAGRTPEAEAAVRALLAGCDILLLPEDPRAVVRALEGALAEGEVPRERLDRSIARLDAAIARIGRFEPPDDADALALAREIASRGLVALRGAPPTGLRDAERPLVILVSGDLGRPLIGAAATLSKEVPWARLVPVGPETGDERLAEVVALAEEARGDGRPVAVLAASQVRMSKGTSGLGGRLDRFASDLLRRARGASVVILGVPWMLGDAEGASFLACAHSDEALSQVVAAERLARGW